MSVSIFFYKNFVKEALNAIKEGRELAEVKDDLENVRQQMEQVQIFKLALERDNNIKLWKLEQARKVDRMIRNKYPVINNMLNIANRLLPRQNSGNTGSGETETNEYICLNQDYYGILCHVLLKKKLIETIEDFIEKVE